MLTTSVGTMLLYIYVLLLEAKQFNQSARLVEASNSIGL